MRHMDLVTIINLISSLVILGVGCWGYIKTKDKLPFYIGVAFGLFSVSHLIALLGIGRSFETTTVLIRIFGYLIILSSMLQMQKEK